MSLKFNRKLIDNVSYEAACVFDVDNDGIADIICGEYWYKGPDFKQKFKICDVMPEGEYYDDFSDYGMDVNGNGYMDIITGAWWGETLRWRENPCNSTDEWIVHDVDECGSIETIRYYDIDNCGTVEIFPNCPGSMQAFYKLIKDENNKGTGKFEKYEIGIKPAGHGMGFGDIDGDGKIEIILCGGYLKQVGSVYDKWEFVETFEFEGAASVPILVYDVNNDGINDIIVGNAHGYGLWWYEQTKEGKFIKHEIDMENAQYHDMQMVDIDNDGELELLTGKRYRAHNGNDPGDNDPVQVCYFKIKDNKFTKHIIDEGDSKEHSGVGIYFWLHDFNNNGFLDIVAPGKEGLYLFENLGIE